MQAIKVTEGRGERSMTASSISETDFLMVFWASRIAARHSDELLQIGDVGGCVTTASRNCLGPESIGAPAISTRERWVTFALRTVYLLYLAARDKRVPMLARVVATTCTAYVLSPINLIPNEIPVIGELDDAVVVALGIVVARRLIPAPLLAELRATAAERFGERQSVAAPDWTPRGATARAVAHLGRSTSGPALLGASLVFYAVVTFAILMPLSLDAVTGNGLTTTGPLAQIRSGRSLSCRTFSYTAADWRTGTSGSTPTFSPISSSRSSPMRFQAGQNVGSLSLKP
jgi:uncharacterized membrane protein YkvA (DUF1232 family)